MAVLRVSEWLSCITSSPLTVLEQNTENWGCGLQQGQGWSEVGEALACSAGSHSQTPRSSYADVLHPRCLFCRTLLPRDTSKGVSTGDKNGKGQTDMDRVSTPGQVNIQGTTEKKYPQQSQAYHPWVLGLSQEWKDLLLEALGGHFPLV